MGDGETTPEAGLQRKNYCAPDISANDLTLIDKLLKDFNELGGITVAFYPSSMVQSHATFKAEANQFASDHQTIGLKKDELAIGVALEINKSISDWLESMKQKIDALLQKCPAKNSGNVTTIPIKTLAIFTHGLENQLQAAPKGQFIKNALEDWAKGIATYLVKDALILLYACLVGGTDPKNKIYTPFAENMRVFLSNNGISATIWGHLILGHTTANHHWVKFSAQRCASTPSGNSPSPDEMDPPCSSTVGENLRKILGEKLANKIIDDKGCGDKLTEKQRKEVNNKAYRAFGGEADDIFQVNTAKPTDPLEVYVREIPYMDIDKVWNDLISEESPDLSSLHVTSEVEKTVEDGLKEFRNRYTQHYKKIEKYIESQIPRE